MDLPAGARLGHYEIQHVLGAGGMGVVYRAFDALLHRPVAIKFITAGDSADARRRLLAEARSASALNHPNICTVHDIAEHGDHRFIVMEFIEGRTLGDMIAGGPPAEDVALGLAVQVASALAHAHDRHVAHGDLKTANVIVTADGRVKVVDFGLAQRYGDGQATETSITAGTPYAMAPEQLRGSAPDSRSDVWSIGVLIQELTSGTRPFAGDTTPALFAAILSQPPAPTPAHVAPGIRRVIDRCLAAEPARRYQSASEVVAALEAISTVSARKMPHDADGAWRIPPQPMLTALGASQIVLVGREQEWSALNASWTRAAAGRRQLVLVAGEPGIGKTRLVMEFARSLAADATVLLGRCDPEALVPHQPFVEALDWYARECPPAALERQLADVDGVWELAQLIAPLARRMSLTPDAVDSNPEGRRYRLFEAMAALVSAIARVRPLVLVLEDLHWADRATLLLLRHLLRSSHEAALCIVATYRESDAEQNRQLADVLAELRREEGVTRIGLDGLAEGHVRQFIETWTGRESPALTRVVAGSTEGNPFFISEVLRHLAETGALEGIETMAATGRDAGPIGLPEGIRETIGRRLARLSDGCNKVLGLASVVGREFTLPVLTGLADMSEDALLDALDEALGARLIHDAPGGRDRYVFTHALVRDTLYGKLTAARQSRLHRQVAEVVDRLAPAGERPFADLAFHYARGSSEADARHAIECALGAAERAAAGFALEEAARFYDIALKALDRLPPDPSIPGQRLDLRVRRGRAFADMGMWAAARTELEAALPLVPAADTTRRTEVLCELSKSSFWMLDVAAVRRFATEALGLAEALGREDLVADAMSWLAGALNAEGDVRAAVEMDRQAAARIGGVKTFGLTRTVITLYHLGLAQEAIERAHEAVAGARATNDPNFRVFALSHLAIALVAAGRYTEALTTFDEMREFGKRHGALPMLARGIAMVGGLHITLGDYARGVELAEEARELARRIGFPPPVVSAGIDLLTVYARTHDPGRAEKLVDHVANAVVAAAGWHGWLWRLRFSQARAELALARGDWPGAIAAATEGIVDSEAKFRRKYVALGYGTRAQARVRAGDRTHALADADRAVAEARGIDDPAVLMRTLSVRLEVDGSDALAADLAACRERIVAHLADAALRRRFLDSELAGSAGTPA